MAELIIQSQIKNPQNQLEQYRSRKKRSIIDIEAMSTNKSKAEMSNETPRALSIFQTTPVSSFTTVPNSKNTLRETSFLSTAKLATRRKKKQKSDGYGQMITAIIHLLLACGLIDLGMFLIIRFNHYGHVWPDSYAKLSISEYRLYHNQMLAIRIVYSPVTIAIGLMIFFPKIIYLLIIFFSKVSFYRAAIVDGSISLLALSYACITGSHAYIVLQNISTINMMDGDDILCYAIRGQRKNASQALRDRCLLFAYKMFGDHLLLQFIIALLVVIVCNINLIRLFSKKTLNTKEIQIQTKTHKKSSNHKK